MPQKRAALRLQENMLPGEIDSRIADAGSEAGYDRAIVQAVGRARGNRIGSARSVRRRSKYGNRKVEVDGQQFDSAAEARRWQELNLMLAAGEIRNLRRQVVYELAEGVRINGRKRPPLRYIADFGYNGCDGYVVEDVKGVITEGYRIKRHLMMLVHGIAIREVKR